MIKKNTNSDLERRLRRELRGDVLFDDFSRGRYSTDASIYQLMPIGVEVPKRDDIEEAAIKKQKKEANPYIP